MTQLSLSHTFALKHTHHTHTEDKTECVALEATTQTKDAETQTLVLSRTYAQTTRRDSTHACVS